MRDEESEDMALRWAKAAWRALSLSIPVDVDLVRRRLGLYVRRQELGATDGYLLSTAKRVYIVVNSLHPIERQRFTICHEIAEFCLMRYLSRRTRLPARHRNFTAGQAKERLCDRFAVNILMPEQLVLQTAKELRHRRGNNKTDVLASRFGVSQNAMKLRLRELAAPRNP